MGCKSMIALVGSATSFVISKHSFQGKFDLKVANNFPLVRFRAVELRRWKYGTKLKLSVLLTDDGIATHFHMQLLNFCSKKYTF